jgi:hypothetical protein
VRLALLLWAGAAPGAAVGFESDAESVARGGIYALRGLEASPGAAVEPGLAVGFTLEAPYVGTELRAAALRVRGARGRWAAAAGLGQLQSPVHADVRLALALQARAGDVRVGAAASLQGLAFESYSTRWRVSWRAGTGATLGHGLELAGVLVFDAPESVPGALRAVGAAQVTLGAHLALALQHEREPGLEPRTRCALVWAPASLHLLAGYDIATATASAGFAWSGARRRLAWGARSHLELGWSHACTLELRR